MGDEANRYGWKGMKYPRGWQVGDDYMEFAWKCAMLLLGQHKWIKRRVENVSFTDQGTTRRAISLDFSLPKDKFVAYSNDNEQPRIAVPVTFLGKGDLIHADVVDGGGQSVPLAGLFDNREFAYAALDYLFNDMAEKLSELGVIAGAHDAETDIAIRMTAAEKAADKEYAKTHGGKSMPDGKRHETRISLAKTVKTTVDTVQPAERLARRIWWHARTRLVNRIIAAKSFSGRDIPPDKLNECDILTTVTNYQPSYDWTLRILYEAVMAKRGDDPQMHEKRNDNLLRLLHIIRQDGNVSGRETMIWEEDGNAAKRLRTKFFSDSVFEAFLDVMEQIVAAIEAKANAADSAVAQSASGETAASDGGRDDLNSGNSRNGSGNRGNANNRDGRNDWRLPAESFILLLSSFSSAYPCIMLMDEEQVAKRNVAKLSFDTGYRETKWDRLTHPNSIHLDFAFQMMGAESNHVEIGRLANSVIAGLEWDARGESLKPLRLSVNSGRVHLSGSWMRYLPFAHLKLKLVSSLSSVLSNIAWSSALTLFALWNTLHAFGIFGNHWNDLYNVGNMLAGLALFFTLWVARRLNDVQHAVSQELSSYPNLLVYGNLILATVSYLASVADSNSDGTTNLHAILPKPFECSISVICLVLSMILTLIVWHGLFSRQPDHASTNPDFDGAEDMGRQPIPMINTPEFRQKRQAGGFSEQYRRLVERIRRLPIFREDEERNRSLFPSETGAYMILEGAGEFRKDVMAARCSYVNGRWTQR
ncbi:hypothetical protein [Bifidobacterium biavatii]|uniref:Uncharacterized protein n=1 Tax=Bifidobacterium biavatii DSM 23969 TaxID=1437608 RepID=A0A087A4M5_9BIFI|nr:hypothetical protein [Bifidobacterium biavatii]KFI53725.1 hypothetical protein BBIA_1323 [Bifidobacterium biavatii DSM 23969]